MRGAFLLLCAISLLASHAHAQGTDPADLVCPRSAPGSVISPPITGSGQVTLTVNTTPAHALVHPHPRIPPSGIVGNVALGTVALALAVLSSWIPWRKWRVPAMLGLVALAILSFVAGCGSSGKTDPGTPTGTYSVAVTGTSGSGSSQIQHTVVAPVTVQ